MPRALTQRTLITRIADDVPVLLAHPDQAWHDQGATPTPAPICLWFHGRTVSKELDPGRYLRWVRAGVAACAIDLPGHGERMRPGWDQSDHTLQVAKQAASEVDAIVRALSEPRFNNAFDTTRLAIGGMSAGGIAALARLCAPHTFTCACLEATTGDFSVMQGRTFHVEHLVEELEPISHLTNWRPIPILALHSEKDEWIPIEGQRNFFNALRDHYTKQGADPDIARLHTWPETGALHEHMGFGKMSNEAKNLQTEFLVQHLGAQAP